MIDLDKLEQLIDPSMPPNYRATLRALAAELRRMRSECERALDTVEAFQDASGLCVPAEERGGDPGGVTPEHVRKHIAELQAELASVRAELERARERTILDAYDRMTPEEKARFTAAGPQSISFSPDKVHRLCAFVCGNCGGEAKGGFFQRDGFLECWPCYMARQTANVAADGKDGEK